MSYEPIETIEHAGMVIEIHHDDNPESPREWGNVGTMVCNHRLYRLGDVQGNRDDVPRGSITLPLYLYDHSGITMSTSPFSCPWDSGMVGMIYCTKEKALKEFGGKILTKKIREKVIKCLMNEVEVYDQYLTGQVYGYVIKDEEGNELESCWGFFGMDHVMEEAKSQAESCAKPSLTYAI